MKYNEYIYGTIVPKEQKYVKNTHYKKHHAKIKAKTQPSVATHFQMFVFILVCLWVLYIAIHYVQISSDIIILNKKISEIQVDIESQKRENMFAAGNNKREVDFDEVYRIATEELGMVYPSQESVIFYETRENEYVRQMDSIPES